MKSKHLESILLFVTFAGIAIATITIHYRHESQENRFVSPIKIDEETMAQFDNGEIYVGIRNTSGSGYRALSLDNGRNYENFQPIPLTTAWNAPMFVLHLRDDHLLLLYNDSLNQARVNLTAVFSSDGGNTFRNSTLISSGSFNEGYPSAVQLPDDNIAIVWEREGSFILFAKLSEILGILNTATITNTELSIRYYRCPSIVLMPDNKLAVSWYGTDSSVENIAQSDLPITEYCKKNKIWGSYSSNFGAPGTWGTETLFGYYKGVGEGNSQNSSAFLRADNRVYLFWDTQSGWHQYGNPIDNIRMLYTDDSGIHWSTDNSGVLITNDGYSYIAQNGIKLLNGDLLLPVYGSSTGYGVGAIISSDNGTSWQRYPQT